MKVMLDVNVILDVLLEPDPFYVDSAAVFERAEEGKDQGYLCSLTFPILFYLLTSEMAKEKASGIICDLRTVFDVSLVDARVVDRALSSTFDDFEDAVQYFSALETGIECFLTRNPDDFLRDDIPVLRPEEYLAFIQSTDE